MNYRIVIPALDAAPYLSTNNLSAQACALTLLIDSASSDDTVTLAQSMGMTVISIPRESFDHGATRQLGVQWARAQGAEYVVFLTQDALRLGHHALQVLLKPFDNIAVAAVCGRQLPRVGAGWIEQHARLFNYPAQGRIIHPDDVSRLGVRAGFMSNSFAAYRMAALDAVGGFPEHCIFGEDMWLALRLLAAGFSTAYAADAQTEHSHGYSLLQEFRRYVDVGVMHQQLYREMPHLPSVTGEGLRFVRSELNYLFKHAPWLIPQAVVRTALKWLAYKVGRHADRLPRRWVARCSMNTRYWRAP